MQKLSTLLLTLVFALSLVACNKDNTSSDSSSLSNFPSQAEQNETDISAEQTSEITSEIETESKTETVSSGITSDKKGSTSTSSSKQNSSSQPTQPTRPTKLNPKTNFKIGRYRAIFLDSNNNQICHRIDMEFQEGEQYNGYVTCYGDRFFTKELCQQEGFTPDEDTSKVVLNGITYYDCQGLFSLVNGIFEMTDTLIKVDNQEGKLDNLSLNTDGTLFLETNGGVIAAKIGTIFTIVE